MRPLRLSSPTEKDLLRLMQDGPTLLELTQRIWLEFGEEMPPKSVGTILASLQNKGFVFLEEGRWWRTPQGITYLEKIIAEETTEMLMEKPRTDWIGLLRTVSSYFHDIPQVDLAVIVIVGAFFMWPAIVAPSNSTFGAHDIVSYFTFQGHVLRESLLKFGEVPLWNPYYFCGMPYLANPQSTLFYLSTPLILLASEVDGIRYAIVLHLILSGLNMYYLLSTLKQRRSGALISAFGYMFSGYAIARIAAGHLTSVYGYSWVPLALALSHKAASTGKLRYAVGTGVVLMLQFQSGALIVLSYTLLLVSMYLAYCYLAFRLRKSLFHRLQQNQREISLEVVALSLRKLGLIAVVIAISAISLSAVKLLPVVEFVFETARAHALGFSGTFEGMSIQTVFDALFQRSAQKYFTIGWGEIGAYLGSIALLGVVAPFLAWKKKHTVFYALVTVFGMLLAMGNYGPIGAYMKYLYDNVPLFSSLLHTPTRFMLISVIGLSVLSGTAVSTIFDRIARLSRKRLVHFAYCLAFVGLIVVLLDLGYFVMPLMKVYGRVGVPSGEPYTSVSPFDLSVCWLEYPTRITAGPSSMLTVQVKVKNTGNTVWLRDSSQLHSPWDPWYDKKGTVHLSIMLDSRDYRFPLPRDIAPNHDAELVVTLTAPDKPGAYPLRVNLVSEFVTWFPSPYPQGELIVTSSHERKDTVVEYAPIFSYGSYHALVWLSEQKQEGHFRIGPYTESDDNLQRMSILGLYHVGGYETRAMLLPHFSRFTSVLSPRRLGLLNVRYMMFTQQVNADNLRPVATFGNQFVYENKETLPRAFYVDRAILVIGRDEDASAFENSLIDASYFDPSRFALIRGQSLLAQDYPLDYLKRFDIVVVLPYGEAVEENRLAEQCRNAGVQMLRYSEDRKQLLAGMISSKTGTYSEQEISCYSTNKIIVKTRNDRPGFLIVSESYFRDWKAYVDGQETPVMLAYSALRGIYLDKPGEHEVLVIFQPISHILGGAITLVAIASALWVILGEAWFPKRLRISGRRSSFVHEDGLT
jgi:hypothetical protein